MEIGRDCWTIEDRQKGTLRDSVQFCLGYMLSLNVDYQFFYGFEPDSREVPDDLTNELGVFMCALYVLHEIVIPV